MSTGMSRRKACREGLETNAFGFQSPDLGEENQPGGLKELFREMIRQPEHNSQEEQLGFKGPEEEQMGILQGFSIYFDFTWK